MKLLLWTSFVMFLGAFGCGHDDHDHDHGDEADVPAEYAGMTNPLAGDPDAATAGAAIYSERCASCHGDTGSGDGPLAGGLEPPPPDLHEHGLDHEDDYYFWRISEGGNGEPVESQMPAWAGVLTDEEIWQVVTYLHELIGDHAG